MGLFHWKVGFVLYFFFFLWVLFCFFFSLKASEAYIGALMVGLQRGVQCKYQAVATVKAHYSRDAFVLSSFTSPISSTDCTVLIRWNREASRYMK